MGLAGVIAAVFAALLAAALLVALYLVWVSWRIRRRAERLVPPPGKFITVDGHRNHYTDQGHGPPILMVHGLGGTQFHMAALPARLKGSFRVIAVDRPGSGFSTRRGDVPANPREHAAFLVRFMDALGIEKPLVVGHSLGGAITLALAVDYPDRIAGIVLISPLTQHRDDVPPQFAGLNIRSPLLRWVVAETISAPSAVRLGPQTLDFVFGPQQPPPDYAVAGGAMIALRPSQFYAASTDFVAIGDTMKVLAPRYGDIKLPAGMVFGTADRVLESDVHGRGLAAAMPGMETVFIEGVGHMPQYSHGDDVEALIRRVAARAFGAPAT